ncbi:MAG TPA: DUF5372 family protein, partial [Actinomycetes bacterium]|nr:DUF5372 family protein [Actinomycetes bacterium]
GWGSPRSRHTAASSSTPSESLVVTHPFHPLAGQRLVVLLERRRPSTGLVFVCEGGPGGRVTLPVAWTDRAPAPAAHRLTTEVLVALAALAGAINQVGLQSIDQL